MQQRHPLGSMQISSGRKHLALGGSMYGWGFPYEVSLGLSSHQPHARRFYLASADPELALPLLLTVHDCSNEYMYMRSRLWNRSFSHHCQVSYLGWSPIQTDVITYWCIACRCICILMYLSNDILAYCRTCILMYLRTDVLAYCHICVQITPCIQEVLLSWQELYRHL